MDNNFLSVENKIKEIVINLPSESPILDYKQRVYLKSKDYEFIKDVCAMLNTTAGIYEDKIIITGVDINSRVLIGIARESWRDDNEWQNLLRKIHPRPQVTTGTVEIDNRVFGYFFIHKNNNRWVYEISETHTRTDEKNRERGVYTGQAFTRFGAANDIMRHDDRMHLEELVARQKGYSFSINQRGNFDRSIVIAGLIGSWDERCDEDKKIIEEITKINYSAFIEEIKRDANGVFFYRDGTWRCRDQYSVITKNAGYIYDDTFMSLINVANKVLFTADKRYSLLREERWASSVINGKVSQGYSIELRKGLVETLAIIANNKTNFVNCSNNTIARECSKLVRNLFNSSDWRVYATVEDLLGLIAEIEPSVFIDSLIHAIEDESSGFSRFLLEEECGIFTYKHGGQLGNILGMLAFDEARFSKSMRALTLLSRNREDFVDDMANIIMPWYPQTECSSETIVGVLKGLFKIDGNIGWALLMKVMPNAKKSGFEIEKPKYIFSNGEAHKLTTRDYWEGCRRYIELAIEESGVEPQRLKNLIGIVDSVPVDVQNKIIESVKTKLVGLDASTRVALWIATKNLVDRHNYNKFKEAPWLLPEDRLKDLTQFLDTILEESERKEAIVRHLFQNDQFALLDNTDNFEKERELLRAAQQAAVRDFYTESGLEGIVRVAYEVENQHLFGAVVAECKDCVDFCTIIRSKDKLPERFMAGLVFSVEDDLLEQSTEGWEDLETSKLLSLRLPTTMALSHIKTMEADAQHYYWNNCKYFAADDNTADDISFIVSELVSHRRASEALNALFYSMVIRNKEVSDELVVKTLMSADGSREVGAMECYHIQEIIKHIQRHDIDDDKMAAVEWKYLNLLEEIDGYPPKTLWKLLSERPSYYITILSLVYNASKDDTSNKTRHRDIAAHAYRLLSGWKRIPGSDSTGTLDFLKLSKWIDEVRRKAKEESLLDHAMRHLGRVLFYAPASGDLFIDMRVAEIIDNDNEGQIRTGYELEAINSRGIHFVDPTGKEDLKLEEEYLDKARIVERKGFINFSETLRSIASFYHDESIRNKAIEPRI